ncbi:hypothetical protein [Allorhodopirellula solitaria]|uniref:hypothetical protein n=1 Tax=Allorhodopirellula solitaria TaxID=2527987 RepID=UPI0011B4A0BF|nr:hypothetical protein [Allorhodopirellula solitaria]
MTFSSKAIERVDNPNGHRGNQSQCDQVNSWTVFLPALLVIVFPANFEMVLDKDRYFSDSVFGVDGSVAHARRADCLRWMGSSERFA